MLPATSSRRCVDLRGPQRHCGLAEVEIEHPVPEVLGAAGLAVEEPDAELERLLEQLELRVEAEAEFLDLVAPMKCSEIMPKPSSSDSADAQAAG